MEASMEALRLYGKRFLLDLVSQLERHSVGQDQLDSVKFRLDWFLGVLSRYTQAKPDVDIPVNSVIEKLRYAQNIIVQLDKDVYSGYKPEKVYSGCKGRPSFLRGRGIHVQQFRLRESMRRSDPEGVLLRALQLTPVSRRVYNVKSPLALWHMDGHHKRIRYVRCFLFLHT